MLRDLRDERSADVPFPPGDTRFSMARTRRFAEEPLPMLLDAYARYGPVFTLRLFHSNVVFMLGPEANHYVLVSHASNFTWRDSHFRDLIGLMGDGLLTIDGDFHRQSRRIMLPAFHHDHVAASLDAIVSESEHALDRLHPGAEIDLYAWTRRLALRVAMRALFGLDPDGERAQAIDAAGLFERALSFYSSDYLLRVVRLPGLPWARMQQAARQLDTLIYSEIAERRADGARGEDLLSLLLDAHDEDGTTLTDLQIRDEVMTLLFAGHDTTTSTVSFMFYELARRPDLAARMIAEQDAVLAGAAPSATQLMSGELPARDDARGDAAQVPARMGRPASRAQSFEFAGHTVPARAFVNYCSWASHHLPDVFDEPEQFRPERFAADARASIPKGATSPSAAARASASACASASSRCARSPRSSSRASRSRSPTTSSCRSARCPPSAPARPPDARAAAPPPPPPPRRRARLTTPRAPPTPRAARPPQRSRASMLST